MPRAPVAGREIRRRSRNGCWNCKARKVKCGEEKPRCSNCERLGDECDYKIRLSWGGRPLKKKQMLNGEEQTEDESMFLPGAGQFSIHQPFPQPPAFVPSPTNDSTAASRKLPFTKPGRKSSGITSFQNVFSVADPSPVLGPTSPTSTSPEELPRGSSHDSSSPPTRQGSQTYFPWPNEQDSPHTNSPIPISNYSSPPIQTSLKQETLEPDTSFNDRPRFSTQFLPISTNFSPQITSPAFAKLNLPNSLSPSFSQYSPQGMIPHQSQQPASSKVFHPPPRHISSPPKRIRRSSSPPLLPTPPPSYYNDHYPVTTINNNYHSPASSLGSPFDFGNNPFTQASLQNTAQEYGLVVPSLAPPTSNQVRRLSVASMLANPTDDFYHYHRNTETENGNGLDYSPQTVSYGISTSEPVADDDDVEEIPRYDLDGQGFGEVYRYRMNAASTYYPVLNGIPKGLDPLPDLLIGNEKNMLYFKHFLEFTARLLVPHDCSENPFKKVLPQMAVGTEKLMNLLLAYSASHRARLCNQPEPTDRINEFLQETITDLNKSLQDDHERTSDSTLATLIMLCSYDIISPNKLISWRNHLNAARGIILSRGETEGIHCRDKVSYFLVRWFAYLDVLGSLSGRDNDQPLFSGKYWINDEADEREDSAVDCVLGFTSKCVSILAKIGELARKSDQEKKIYLDEKLAQGVTLGPEGNQGIVKTWKPPPYIEEQAKKLEDELDDAREHASDAANGQLFTCETGANGHKHDHHHHAPHSHHNFEPSDQVNEELMATNEAFHLAASVHLYRRVLNFPSNHAKVQRAVGAIVGAMHKVRHNGEAENCLLFPLFTAGCEAIQDIHRTYTLRRMQAVEKIGMTQVTAARRLMERVWKEGVPWETLSDGEFIG